MRTVFALPIALLLSAPVFAEDSAQHKAAVEYWSHGYSGADLTQGDLNCKAPAFPPVSKKSGQIKQLQADYLAWQACYAGVVANLKKVQPAGTAIPEKTFQDMSDKELDASIAHLNDVYARVAHEQGVKANATIAAYENWNRQTTAWLMEENEKRVADEVDISRRRMDAMAGLSPAGKVQSVLGGGGR